MDRDPYSLEELRKLLVHELRAVYINVCQAAQESADFWGLSNEELQKILDSHVKRQKDDQ